MLAVRRQLSTEKVAAENASRLLEDALLRRLSRRRIGRLAADIELLDKRLIEIVATDAALAHRYRLLTSMPGVGPVLACTLIALLPELGGMTRKQVAALIGVAPYAFESGTLKGRRCIWGGRANVRQGLYMAAMSASNWKRGLKAFHDRLEAGGVAGGGGGRGGGGGGGGGGGVVGRGCRGHRARGRGAPPPERRAPGIEKPPPAPARGGAPGGKAPPLA